MWRYTARASLGFAQSLGSDESWARCRAIVTDYKMPRMDRAEPTRCLRDIDPNLPAPLITGYAGSTENVRNERLSIKRSGASVIVEGCG